MTGTGGGHRRGDDDCRVWVPVVLVVGPVAWSAAAIIGWLGSGWLPGVLLAGIAVLAWAGWGCWAWRAWTWRPEGGRHG